MGLCHVYFPVAPGYADVEFEEQYGVYVRSIHSLEACVRLFKWAYANSYRYADSDHWDSFRNFLIHNK